LTVSAIAVPSIEPPRSASASGRGAGRERLAGERAGEVLEIVRPGDEIGLAVQLDDRAAAALRLGGHHALARRLAGALLGLGDPLLAEEVDRRGHVAVVLFQAFLQSIMPAPVRWRSSWTSLAVKVAGMLVVTLILAAAGRPGSVAWKRRRRGPAARLV
jgi:hypothetical protein